MTQKNRTNAERKAKEKQIKQNAKFMNSMKYKKNCEPNLSLRQNKAPGCTPEISSFPKEK